MTLGIKLKLNSSEFSSGLKNTSKDLSGVNNNTQSTNVAIDKLATSLQKLTGINFKNILTGFKDLGIGVSQVAPIVKDLKKSLDVTSIKQSTQTLDESVTSIANITQTLKGALKEAEKGLFNDTDSYDNFIDKIELIDEQLNDLSEVYKKLYSIGEDGVLVPTRISIDSMESIDKLKISYQILMSCLLMLDAMKNKSESNLPSCYHPMIWPMSPVVILTVIIMMPY